MADEKENLVMLNTKLSVTHHVNNSDFTAFSDGMISGRTVSNLE
jgi:hypothetical protein